MKKTKRYIIYCEPCGHKQIVHDIESCELTEIKTCPVQTNLPKLDPATNKTIPAKINSRAKMFKCECCGRGVVAKQIPASYTTVIEKREKTESEQQQKEELVKDGWIPSPFEEEAKKAIEGAKIHGNPKKNKHS